jgi:hypothetical protein
MKREGTVYLEVVKSVKKVVANEIGKKSCDFNPEQFLKKIVNELGIFYKGAAALGLATKEGKMKKDALVTALLLKNVEGEIGGEKINKIQLYENFCKLVSKEPKAIDSLSNMIINDVFDILEEEKKQRKSNSIKSGGVRRRGGKSKSVKSRRGKKSKSVKSRRGKKSKSVKSRKTRK